MSVRVQIRNVPNDLHRRLKARAALAGMTLSEYLRREIRRVAERPSAYDAVYIALAEALDAPLLTRDRRLAQAPGHRARVEPVRTP